MVRAVSHPRRYALELVRRLHGVGLAILALVACAGLTRVSQPSVLAAPAASEVSTAHADTVAGGASAWFAGVTDPALDVELARDAANEDPERDDEARLIAVDAIPGTTVGRCTCWYVTSGGHASSHVALARSRGPPA